jgi:hypothetical protein
MWDPRRLTTLWTSTACNRYSFTFTFCTSISSYSRSPFHRNACHVFMQSLDAKQKQTTPSPGKYLLCYTELCRNTECFWLMHNTDLSPQRVALMYAPSRGQDVLLAYTLYQNSPGFDSQFQVFLLSLSWTSS